MYKFLKILSVPLAIPGEECYTMHKSESRLLSAKIKKKKEALFMLEMINHLLEGFKVLLYLIQKIKALFGLPTTNYDDLKFF